MTHRPIWPVTAGAKVTFHTDASLSGFDSTLAAGPQRAGTSRFLETQGYCDPVYRETAHTTILKLLTVPLDLEEFSH